MKIFSLADRPDLAGPSTGQIIYPPKLQNGHSGAHSHGMIGGTSAASIQAVSRANDPLAGMTAKRIFFDCIWLSKESTATKLMLVCIWRYFDANARSSSMSCAQIASDCMLHESSAKRIAKDILGTWLTVSPQQGFKTASGRQNLYHGICPPELVEELRELRRKGKTVEPDEAILAAADTAVTGVASGDTTLNNVDQEKTLSPALTRRVQMQQNIGLQGVPLTTVEPHPQGRRPRRRTPTATLCHREVVRYAKAEAEGPGARGRDGGAVAPLLADLPDQGRQVRSA